MKQQIIEELFTFINMQADQANDEQDKNDILSEIQIIKEMNTKRHHEVEIGSLISVERNQNVGFYFLTPMTSGQFFKIGEKTILTLSTFSKLGSELLGKSTGNTVSFEGKDFKIVEII